MQHIARAFIGRDQETAECLARHLRDPHRTQVLCNHAVRKDGVCKGCGKRMAKVRDIR